MASSGTFSRVRGYRSPGIMGTHDQPAPQSAPHRRRDEPFRLASGQLSHDYIDGKYAVDTGERLGIVSRAVGFSRDVCWL